jgi:hypothetical protein
MFGASSCSLVILVPDAGDPCGYFAMSDDVVLVEDVDTKFLCGRIAPGLYMFGAIKIISTY